jgi:hypothetical protein
MRKRIEDKDIDIDMPEDHFPDRRPRIPPSRPSSPAPATEQVTEDRIAAIASQSLPDMNALLDFLNWSNSSLPDLMDRIVNQSTVNINELANDMSNWRNVIRQRQEELDSRQEQPPEDGQVPPWPPMPGLRRDIVCTSLFDANSLALRGRRSVLAK